MSRPTSGRAESQTGFRARTVSNLQTPAPRSGRDAMRVVFAGLGRMGFHLVRHVAGAATTGRCTRTTSTRPPESGWPAPAGLTVDRRACRPTSAPATCSASAFPTAGRPSRHRLARPTRRRERADDPRLLQRLPGRRPSDRRRPGAVGSHLHRRAGHRRRGRRRAGHPHHDRRGRTTTRWSRCAGSPSRSPPGSCSPVTVGAGALLKTLNNMIFNIASIAMHGGDHRRPAGRACPTTSCSTCSTTAPRRTTSPRCATRSTSGPARFDAGMRVGLVDKDLADRPRRRRPRPGATSASAAPGGRCGRRRSTPSAPTPTSRE